MNKNMIKRLKLLRTNHHLTQDDVAKKLNISRQAYTAYEIGQNDPPADITCALANLYQVSTDYLLGQTSSDYELPEDYTKPLLESSSYTDSFLEYVSSSKNKRKMSTLSPNEQRVLFLYENLDKNNQNEIVEILEIKYRHQKNNPSDKE